MEEEVETVRAVGVEEVAVALRLPSNRSSALPLTVPSIVKRWVPWLREDRSFGGVNDLELTVFTNLTDSNHLPGVTTFEIE